MRKLITKEVDIHDTNMMQFFKSKRELNFMVFLGICLALITIILLLFFEPLHG